MKILIGAPVHISKDYSIDRWLKNVARVQKNYPCDVMLVDNSPGIKYCQKLDSLCHKYKVKNYQINHLKIKQGSQVKKSTDEQIHERIIRSEEIIREKVLIGNYDAWFFWESDILIPNDSLTKLTGLMQSADLKLVIHNCWVNNIPNQINFHFGVTLFSRQCLKKYSFIPDFNEKDAPPNWYEAEQWYRQRLRKEKYNFLEVAGLIEPIYHLAR